MSLDDINMPDEKWWREKTKEHFRLLDNEHTCCFSQKETDDFISSLLEEHKNRIWNEIAEMREDHIKNGVNRTHYHHLTG